MSEKEIITLIIAIYGAVLASTTLLWNIRRDLKDKAKLKIDCYIGNRIPDVEGYGRYLVYSLTNTGRRAINITTIGGYTGVGKYSAFVITSRDLPKTLNEGEYTIEYAHDFAFLGKPLKYLCAYNSTGKCYKFKGKQLRKLVQKYQETRKQNIAER